jgi:hypothetical protein
MVLHTTFKTSFHQILSQELATSGQPEAMSSLLPVSVSGVLLNNTTLIHLYVIYDFLYATES